MPFDTLFANLPNACLFAARVGRCRELGIDDGLVDFAETIVLDNAVERKLPGSLFTNCVAFRFRPWAAYYLIGTDRMRR
jgi:hypothetical protein